MTAATLNAMTAIYLTVSVCLWIAFVFKIRGLRRRPAEGRPPLRPICISLGLVATAYTLCAPAVAMTFDHAVGVPNLAPMLGYCLAIGYGCSAQGMLLYWRLPVDKAGRSMRRRVVIYAAITTLMVILWAAGASAVRVEHVVDFDITYATTPFITQYLLLFFAAFGISMAIVAVLCWRWSASVGTWLRRALRTYTIGVLPSLLFAIGKIAIVITACLSVGANSTLSYQSGVVVPLVSSAGAPILLAGLVLAWLGPRVGRRVRAIRIGFLRYPVDFWSYCTLRPLHRALSVVDPRMIHRPRTIDERLSIRLRLFWRLTEIRDWQWQLRTFADPTIGVATRDLCAANKLTDEETRAAIEAAQVKAALLVSERGSVHQDEITTDTDTPVITTLAVATERDHLTKVALAFSRSPIVDTVVMQVAGSRR